MAFWGEHSGKKHWLLTFLPKKPPSRKSHQFEVTPVPQVLMSKQIKDLSPRWVEEDTVSLVYYETSETNVVPKSSADLVPFIRQTIENLKLDQMKSRKLQKAIAAAEASMWVVIISIQLSENDCALSIALMASYVVLYLLNSVVIANDM